MPKQKKQSRPERWASACARANDALQELVDIQSEYYDWKDNLPENLSQSALGQKLEAVCDLELQDALDMVREAAESDLPRGFGKD